MVDENQFIEDVMHATQDRRRTQTCPFTDATVGAAILDVHLHQSVRRTEKAPSFLHTEGSTAGGAFASPITVSDDCVSVAMGTFFS